MATMIGVVDGRRSSYREKLKHLLTYFVRLQVYSRAEKSSASYEIGRLVPLWRDARKAENHIGMLSLRTRSMLVQ